MYVFSVIAAIASEGSPSGFFVSYYLLVTCEVTIGFIVMSLIDRYGGVFKLFRFVVLGAEISRSSNSTHTTPTEGATYSHNSALSGSATRRAASSGDSVTSTVESAKVVASSADVESVSKHESTSSSSSRQVSTSDTA